MVTWFGWWILLDMKAIRKFLDLKSQGFTIGKVKS